MTFLREASAYSSMSSPTAFAGKNPYTPRAVIWFFAMMTSRRALASVKIWRLLTVRLVLKNAGIDAFQPPGVEDWRPVNELAQGGQRKIVQHTHAGEGGHGQVFGSPHDWSPPGAG